MGGRISVEPVAVRHVLPERRRRRDRDWQKRIIIMGKAWWKKHTPQPVGECSDKGYGVREKQIQYG